jgi:hypothetical protein
MKILARNTQDRDVVGNESNDACTSRGADRAQPECSSSSPAVRHARPIRRRRREQGSGGEARVHSHPRTSVSLVVDPRSQVTYGAQWRESARQERDAHRLAYVRATFFCLFIYLFNNQPLLLPTLRTAILFAGQHARSPPHGSSLRSIKPYPAQLDALHAHMLAVPEIFILRTRLRHHHIDAHTSSISLSKASSSTLQRCLLCMVSLQSSRRSG